MREMFFIGVVVFGSIAIVIYFVWMLIVALYTDWRLRIDVKAIKASNDGRRAHRDEENRKRLDNSCDHSFGSDVGGFPPNACTKCGLERERPKGACDHVWKISTDAVPASYCDLCKKKFGGTIVDRRSVFKSG